MNKANLEAVLTKLTGIDCEITIRGLRAFTISFNAECQSAVKTLRDYFGNNVKTWESDYDLECDQTAIWFTV